MILLSLKSINLQRENGVSLQYVAHRGNSLFCYHLKAQISNVRTVLESNMWRIEESSDSVIT
jgi:hypothetical protein